MADIVAFVRNQQLTSAEIYTTTSTKEIPRVVELEEEISKVASLTYECNLHRNISDINVADFRHSKCFMRLSRGPHGSCEHILRLATPCNRDNVIKPCELFVYKTNIENKIEEFTERVERGCPITSIGAVQADASESSLLQVLNNSFFYLQSLTCKYLLNRALVMASSPAQAASFFCNYTANLTNCGETVFLFQNYLKHFEFIGKQEVQLFKEQLLSIFDIIQEFLFTHKKDASSSQRGKKRKKSMLLENASDGFDCCSARQQQQLHDNSNKKRVCKLKHLRPKFVNFTLYERLHLIICVECCKFSRNDVNKLSLLTPLIKSSLIEKSLNLLANISS